MSEAHGTSKPIPEGRPIVPSLGRVINALNLVSSNADIEQIELELRKDPALSLRLFQYIHSAGFGLATPVRTYRQAVMVVGYKPLYRWLSLLLISANREPEKMELGFHAAVRGRFMEDLGREQLERSSPDDLFVTGVFSLVDRIFDHPMHLLLGTMTLPEDICDALLSRAGPYGPLLRLAEALEQDDAGEAERLGDELLLDPKSIGAAHKAATEWVAQLGIGT